jgi:hypothetical protein
MGGSILERRIDQRPQIPSDRVGGGRHQLGHEHHRQVLDAGVDVRITGGWSSRLSVLYTRDSVVPEGIGPSDLRASLGVAYATPR